MKMYPKPKAPASTIMSANPLVNASVIFVSVLGGIIGTRATSRWIDRVAPQISSKISLGVTTAQAVSGMLDDDDEDGGE